VGLVVGLYGDKFCFQLVLDDFLKIYPANRYGEKTKYESTGKKSQALSYLH